jgi:hypothetical protein
MQPKYMYFDNKKIHIVEASDHQELPKWNQSELSFKRVFFLNCEVLCNRFLRPTLSSPKVGLHCLDILWPFNDSCMQHVGPQTIRYHTKPGEWSWVTHSHNVSKPSPVVPIVILVPHLHRMPYLWDAKEVVAIPNPSPRKIQWWMWFVSWHEKTCKHAWLYQYLKLSPYM